MIRTIKLTSIDPNKSKIQHLHEVLVEYNRLVNVFIPFLTNKEKLGAFEHLKTDTWLSARMQTCASRQALSIVKSMRTRERKQRYKQFKRVQYKAQQCQRHLWLCNFDFNKFKLKYKKIPQYKPLKMELSYMHDFQSNALYFDTFVRIKSITSKRGQLYIKLPFNYHKHYNKYVREKWNLKNSIGVEQLPNGQVRLSCFFEKEAPALREPKNLIAYDVGINKLITTNEGHKLGLGLKALITKLNSKVQGSKGWKRTVAEIHNYIKRTKNEFIRICIENNIDTIVCENLYRIQIGTKQSGRVNKTTRKLLAHWNLGSLNEAMANSCEAQGLRVARVSPSYTSQTCPKCKHRDRENRHGEHFKCLKCGYNDDADIVGAVNILHRFSMGESQQDNPNPVSSEANKRRFNK